MSTISTIFDKQCNVLADMYHQKQPDGTYMGIAFFNTHASLKTLDFPQTLQDMFPQFPEIPGFTLQGGERKFLVLEYDFGFDVYIGPLLCDGMYFHKMLIEGLKTDLERRGDRFRGRPVGGGEIRLILKPGEPLTVEFGSQSVDFGVFTPRLMLYREYFQKVFGHASGREVKVKFDYKG